MKIEEMRNMSREDLSQKLVSLKEELSRLNYKKVVGQVEKPHQFKALRRDIARINTLLNEKRQLE